MRENVNKIFVVCSPIDKKVQKPGSQEHPTSIPT
jgi:hypothetical protein